MNDTTRKAADSEARFVARWVLNHLTAIGFILAGLGIVVMGVLLWK